MWLLCCTHCCCTTTLLGDFLPSLSCGTPARASHTSSLTHSFGSAVAHRYRFLNVLHIMEHLLLCSVWRKETTEYSVSHNHFVRVVYSSCMYRKLLQVWNANDTSSFSTLSTLKKAAVVQEEARKGLDWNRLLNTYTRRDRQTGQEYRGHTLVQTAGTNTQAHFRFSYCRFPKKKRASYSSRWVHVTLLITLIGLREDARMDCQQY